MRVATLRRAAMALSVGLVLWAGSTVPMPVFETRPGGAYLTEDLVEISAAAGPINGELRMLTVRQSTPSAFEALAIAVDPDREMLPEQQRTPAGLDPSLLNAIRAEQFTDSFTTAVAVAAQAAGYDVTVRTKAVVAQVMPSGPSDGALLPGDRITAIDGVEVASGMELVEELQRRTEPETVTLQLLREDEELAVDVTLGVVAELEHPGLGIVIETLTEEVDLPFDAALGDTNIVGSSAGMMIALTTLDLLLDEDLTRGRVIAGTGTIRGDGSVGPISGIPQKVRGALDAGAELLLVPLQQRSEARTALEELGASNDVELVGVATLDEALTALRR